ncbi:putative Sybindin-like protein [Hamiltosporidium tvaerminnensis]|uniref:Trafficking protein particle complex subunit n=1 Tax=Hamiltosporidium tvaerminnensis TaxID=1176355 RepID=A0A4Q9L1S8_9MICR|nr:Trafficking protein particle complex subunit 4 [Hamiltosporidium tvaerminnensis]TBU00781.1 putative Sybindin-like protein [Hamiltosporidium tvaerminnensis]TBU13583.1 putative Sybindin-like protein [Hamiltosporidium tvaerminnensis]
MIHQFFIVNRFGSMLYSYEEGIKSEDNKLLVLTSTLHSLYYIMNQIKENDRREIRMYLKKRIITIFCLVSGAMFIFVSNNDIKREVFNKIYRMYIDYVMCNPFYIMDMPINCHLFVPEEILKNY